MEVNEERGEMEWSVCWGLCCQINMEGDGNRGDEEFLEMMSLKKRNST